MSRKKKMNPGQRWIRRSFSARYSVGNRVRVKPGTADPDFGDIPLGGWAGVITEVNRRSNPPNCLIEWDQPTLDHMHPVYRQRCERDGLDVKCMWLAEADLAPDDGEPAVIEQPTNISTLPLSQDDQDDRIRAVFGLTSDDPLPSANMENLRQYGCYLLKQLRFPFQANFIVGEGPFEGAKHRITVVGMPDADECDEDAGLLCDAEFQGRSIELPLADLEVPAATPQRQLVEDYSYWFGNWQADDEFESPKSQASVRTTLVRLVLSGAFGGIVLGSVVGALEGAMTGALVGAAILGLVGLAIGATHGRAAGAMLRCRYGALAGATFGTVVGGLIGAVIGAMFVAFVGTLVGGITGALAGRLLTKLHWTRIGSVAGAVIGAGVGAVVLACYQDQEKALAGALYGALLGAGAVVFLMAAAFGLMFLAVRNRAS